MSQGKQPELIQHPQHYNSHPSGVECKTIIQEFDFNIGTAIKHLWRAGLKPNTPILQDLRKAIQYILFEVERQESLLCDRCKSEPFEDNALRLCRACMSPSDGMKRPDATAFVITKEARSEPESIDETEMTGHTPGMCVRCRKEEASNGTSGLCDGCTEAVRDGVIKTKKRLLCKVCKQSPIVLGKHGMCHDCHDKGKDKPDNSPNGPQHTCNLCHQSPGEKQYGNLCSRCHELQTKPDHAQAEVDQAIQQSKRKPRVMPTDTTP